MKKMSEFLPQNFQFLVVKFSIYMNRRVFVMNKYGEVIVSLYNYIAKNYLCVMFNP